MTPEKDTELCQKYPKIFRDRNGSPQETCMHWGFECSDGWYDIIDVLCRNIQAHVDHLYQRQQYELKQGRITDADLKSAEDFQVVALQVKEKFGGLRFYVSGADDCVLGMLQMAESISLRTCEECGARGKAEGPGWIRTLCNPCREARKHRKFK